VAYYSEVFDDTATGTESAEAAARLAGVNLDDVTGRVIGHADVLNGSLALYEFTMPERATPNLASSAGRVGRPDRGLALHSGKKQAHRADQAIVPILPPSTKMHCPVV